MSKNPQKISVIGAGIMGIMSAYALQNRFPDAQITLCDTKGFPANNASFAAGGMIAPLSELDHMPHHYLDAGFAAISLWSDAAHSLPDTFEFTNNGSLFITHQQDRHLLERFKSILPMPSDDWENINADQITALEPSLKNNTFRQGIHMKREAHLHPRQAMNALLNTISYKEQRKACPDKESQSADWVIDCRGIEAKSNAPDLRGVKGEILIVHNPEFTLARPLRLMHPRYPLYIVPRQGNIFMIGATIIESDSENHVSLRSGMELMSALYSIDRSFGDAKIIEILSGIRPSYPDNLPQIHIKGNIISANGLYRHGFLFSPVLAQTITHYIAGEEYEHKHLFLRKEDNEHHLEWRRAHA